MNKQNKTKMVRLKLNGNGSKGHKTSRGVHAGLFGQYLFM